MYSKGGLWMDCSPRYLATRLFRAPPFWGMGTQQTHYPPWTVDAGYRHVRRPHSASAWTEREMHLAGSREGGGITGRSCDCSWSDKMVQQFLSVLDTEQILLTVPVVRFLKEKQMIDTQARQEMFISTISRELKTLSPIQRRLTAVQ